MHVAVYIFKLSNLGITDAQSGHVLYTLQMCQSGCCMSEQHRVDALICLKSTKASAYLYYYKEVTPALGSMTSVAVS